MVPLVSRSSSTRRVSRLALTRNFFVRDFDETSSYGVQLAEPLSAALLCSRLASPLRASLRYASLNSSRTASLEPDLRCRASLLDGHLCRLCDFFFESRVYSRKRESSRCRQICSNIYYNLFCLEQMNIIFGMNTYINLQLC